MIDWIADVMPLAQAAAEDPGLLSKLVLQVLPCTSNWLGNWSSHLRA